LITGFTNNVIFTIYVIKLIRFQVAIFVSTKLQNIRLAIMKDLVWGTTQLKHLAKNAFTPIGI